MGDGTPLGDPPPAVIPALLTNAPLGSDANDHVIVTGAIFNLPAALIIAVLSGVCYIGMRETAGANTFMVSLKVAIIVPLHRRGHRFHRSFELAPLYSGQHPGVRPFRLERRATRRGHHLFLLRRLVCCCSFAFFAACKKF